MWLAQALDSTQVTEITVTKSSGMAFGTIMLIFLVAWIVSIIALWKVFEKAGHAGWKCIIPYYNVYIMIKIAGRPGWWLLLFLIPFVNFVVLIILSLDIAKAFGKSAVFGIFGLVIFSFIGYLILGFGDAKYDASKAASYPTPTAPAA